MADKYVERLSEDEGLTSGLGDDEAEVLLASLRTAVGTATSGKSSKDADDAYVKIAARGRLVSKVIAAWCIDGEKEEARRLWKAGAGKGSLDALPTDDAVAAIQELLSREGLYA
jgi:hypothetical protein